MAALKSLYALRIPPSTCDEVFVPSSIVIGRSVFSRIVKHGMRGRSSLPGALAVSEDKGGVLPEGEEVEVGLRRYQFYLRAFQQSGEAEFADILFGPWVNGKIDRMSCETSCSAERIPSSVSRTSTLEGRCKVTTA